MFNFSIYQRFISHIEMYNGAHIAVPILLLWGIIVKILGAMGPSIKYVRN